MNLALYRKYRPATFAEVIGQDHVTGPLSRALASGRLHHAYLFSGPRGCGKTSSARILARSLNCEQGPTPDPCGVCDSCVGLAPGGPGTLDVVEIDAASHGGVDDARDLRERAFFAPVASRFKVYVIDEAHMVTSQGFNALLKLVEEPPGHVMFVFATTEPDKVIPTIRSRTHAYPFRLVPSTVLRDHLAHICAAEGVTVEPAVLPLVVRAGAGSVRDALSVLDQLMAGSGGGPVGYAEATALLGFTDAALLDEVVESFLANDAAAVFGAVERVVEGGIDPRRFATDLLERYRDLIVMAALGAGDTGSLVDVPPDQLVRLRAQASRAPAAELSRAADLLSEGVTEMRGATSPRLLLELVCARMLLPAADDDEAALRVRVGRLELRLAIAADAPVAGGSPAADAALPGAGRRSGGDAGDRDAGGRDARGEATAVAGSGTTPSRSPARADGWPQGPGSPAPDGPPTLARSAGPSRRPDRPEPAGQGAGEEARTAGPPRPSGLPAVAAGLDVAAVRRAWPDVLEAVKAIRKTPYALLLNATPQELAGGRLSISFNTSGLARQFGDPYAAVLGQALQQVLGVSWSVVAVTSTAAAAPVSPPGRPADPANGTTPPHAAGQDRDQEPEADPDSDPRTDEEGDVVALLQRGLGARVIEDRSD